MLFEKHYNNGLLLLSYLLVSADGKIEHSEYEALVKICEKEGISQERLWQFVDYAQALPERSVYNKALEEVDQCTPDEQLRIFCWLYRISEADGHVHVKEIRFLMYSLKKAGIEFEDVLKAAEDFPAI